MKYKLDTNKLISNLHSTPNSPDLPARNLTKGAYYLYKKLSGVFYGEISTCFGGIDYSKFDLEDIDLLYSVFEKMDDDMCNLTKLINIFQETPAYPKTILLFKEGDRCEFQQIFF